MKDNSLVNIITEYKKLQTQLVGDPGSEDTMDEAMWNEQILNSMIELLDGVNEDIAKQIRLNHL